MAEALLEAVAAMQAGMVAARSAEVAMGLVATAATAAPRVEAEMVVD